MYPQSLPPKTIRLPEGFPFAPLSISLDPLLTCHHQGYTIPLDKRLAADGRGLQTTVINDKFASLSEALFTAESKAREAITLRAAMQKELLLKEKTKKEAELRDLAMKARLEKTGGVAGIASRLDTGGRLSEGGY